MISKVIVVPEDDSGECFAIRDQNGNHLSDADSESKAIFVAKELAEAQNLDRIEVLLSSHA